GSVEGRKPPGRPRRYSCDLVRRCDHKDRSPDAGIGSRREVRRRQEAGEGHVRKERIRCVCVAARRSRRCEDRTPKPGRRRQGDRRAFKMRGSGARSVLAPYAAVRAALLLATLALSACHGGPPKIVPPPPTAPRLNELQRNINTILAEPALARGTW